MGSTLLLIERTTIDPLYLWVISSHVNLVFVRYYDEMYVVSPLVVSCERQLHDTSPLFVLGNAVISKIFLRTCKIMVMHSNERGEYRLRTLVDRKRKRYDNTVDVVVRLHDQPI